MLIELKEETWEGSRVPKIALKLNKKNYIKKFEDRTYIDLDDLFDLLGILEDEYDYSSDKCVELTKELDEEYRESRNKDTFQEMIWEGNNER